MAFTCGRLVGSVVFATHGMNIRGGVFEANWDHSPCGFCCYPPHSSFSRLGELPYNH